MLLRISKNQEFAILYNDGQVFAITKFDNYPNVLNWASEQIKVKRSLRSFIRFRISNN